MLVVYGPGHCCTRHHGAALLGPFRRPPSGTAWDGASTLAERRLWLAVSRSSSAHRADHFAHVPELTRRVIALIVPAGTLSTCSHRPRVWSFLLVFILLCGPASRSDGALDRLSAVVRDPRLMRPIRDLAGLRGWRDAEMLALGSINRFAARVRRPCGSRRQLRPTDRRIRERACEAPTGILLQEGTAWDRAALPRPAIRATGSGS